MLVVVHIRDIHLTQPVVGIVAIHLGEHTNFQTPVAGNADVREHIAAEREFTRQGVAEAVHVVQVLHVAHGLLQRAQQRRHQQATYPPVDLATGDACVVALAELVVELGV